MLAPWKKSYDKPRQHSKKQRHYFADKGLYSWSYGFSSSHVWMWELNYTEGWALKNWCFWTVVLEKTLESPCYCKDIQFSSIQLLSCVRLFATPGLQHARLPYRSPIPGASLNSCPSSRWCHPTISSSVVPFFSCPQSFPASGSFPMSQLFASGGQSIAVLASASVLRLISFRMDWLDPLAVQETL